MKLYQFILISFLICSAPVHAQRIWIDVYGGATNYQGDLQDKAFTFDQAHLAGGLGVNYQLTNRLSVRAALMAGRLSADDKYGRNKVRNLNFTSNLGEAQIGLQYHLFPVGEHSITPYIFASAALFRFNPFTTDTMGTRYYLRELSTEGQGFIEGKEYYKLTSFAIPFGGGLKLSLTDNINVGLELGFRKLFTDYLDDVSTAYVDRDELIANRGLKAAELAYRGDEIKNGRPYPPAGTLRGGNKKDWYYFTALTLSFRLPSSGEGTEGGRGRRASWACPVNVR